jgi:ribosomal protein S18 acetylase RimI-like enzyme
MLTIQTTACGTAISTSPMPGHQVSGTQRNILRRATMSVELGQPSENLVWETRHAGAGDIDQARELVRRVLPDDHRVDYSRNIGLSGTVSLVVTCNDCVVGFLSALTTPKSPPSDFWDHFMPYIGFVGVLPEYQGLGIGTELLTSARILLLSNALFASVYLNCTADLDGYYESLGFERVSADEIAQRYGKPVSVSTFRCGQPRGINICVLPG